MKSLTTMRATHLIKDKKLTDTDIQSPPFFYPLPICPSLSLSLSGFSLTCVSNPLSFGDEPVSNCLMSSQGTRAPIPPCFQRDPGVKGTDRTYKVT